MLWQLNFFVKVNVRAFIFLVISLALFMMGFGVSHAVQVGHGRVNSVAGAPLLVSIPIKGLSAQDINVLSAAVADAPAWSQAGLTVPAAISSLSVTVEPGLNSSSRQLVLRSTQAVNRPVIDVLITLNTASGMTSIQSSYLVLVNNSVSGVSNSLIVSPGDTLYAIALKNSVGGADIYQVMWAIFSANPRAFIADNMNLLRAGVPLNIPDAADMRAVNANFARAMFAQHESSFKARRQSGQPGLAKPATATVAAIVEATQSSSTAQPKPQTGAAEIGDQVKLASSQPQDARADAQVAQANEMKEMQSRVEALQKNVDDLKATLKSSQALINSSGLAGATGSAGATGATGAPGTPGTPGALGAPGAPGVAGVAGATGSARATELTAAESVSGRSAKLVQPDSAIDLKQSLSNLKQYASDHVLGVVLGISALLALIIAFFLGRAGRQARDEKLEQPEQASPAMAAEFDQKLQSINLNLNEDDTQTPIAPSSKTGV